LKLELWKIGLNQKGRGPACQPHPPLKRTRHRLVTALATRGHTAAPPPHADHAVSPPHAPPLGLILVKQRRGGNFSFAAALLLTVELSRAFLYSPPCALCSPGADEPCHQSGNLPPRARPPPPHVREPSCQAGGLLQGIPPGFFLLPGSLHADRLHRPLSEPDVAATSFASSAHTSSASPTTWAAASWISHR
jgi:hypothetical protein